MAATDEKRALRRVTDTNVDGVEYRICKNCKQNKPKFTNYYANGSRGYSTCCRPCKNKQRTQWFKRNETENKKKLSEWGKEYNSRPEIKEHNKTKNRQWFTNNKEQVKKYRQQKLNELNEKRRGDVTFDEAIKLKRKSYSWLKTLDTKYNMTLEQYEDMIDSQNNQCAICFIDASDTPRNKLVIDHCHETGKVRGLLCDFCNTSLGKCNDNLTTIFNMYKYLYNSKKQSSE